MTIEKFAKLISVLADYAGLLSFVAMIFVYYNTKSIKEKLQEFDGFYNFTVDKTELIKEFKAIINFSQKNGTYHIDVTKIANLHRILRKLESHSKFMGETDTLAVIKIKAIMGNNNYAEPEKVEIINCIQNIIGFLELDHRIQYKGN